MSIHSLFSNLSIRMKILIGFVPIFVVLIVLAISSYQKFRVLSLSFDELLDTTHKDQTFLEIEKDIVELQRNVLVYSYLGYQGILRKIEFLQNELESRFDMIAPVAAQDDATNDRFQRMFNHYVDYSDSFDEVVVKKALLKDLSTNKLGPLFEESYTVLEQIAQEFENDQDFKDAYIVLLIERDLLQVHGNINLFESAPDAALIREANQLIEDVHANTTYLQGVFEEGDIAQYLAEFIRLLDQYEGIFAEIGSNNSIYIHLVNVVLAGKASEINALSKELDELISARSEVLSSGIIDDIQNAQKNYVSLSFVAAGVGFFSAFFIAMLIARPVNSMASRLSMLAKGKSETEIPGQNRKDEVGQMARAANQFKNLANQTEVHAEALKFSNRALKERTLELTVGKTFQELIMNNVPDMLFVKDSQFRIVQANDAFLSAYPEDVRDSVLGTTTLEKYNAEEADCFLYFDRKALEEGFSETEETIEFPDKKVRTLITKKVRFQNAEGENFILGVGRDITDMKQAELDLKESEERYEISVKGSSVGLWDWNISTEHLFWSDRLKEILGITAHNFAPKFESFTDRIHLEDKPDIFVALTSHLKNKTPFDIECRLKHESGNYIWSHIRGHAIWDDSGEAIRMAGSMTDISSRKTFEQQLVEANAELEEFAYRTSHDLRSPIVSSIALLDYSNTMIEEGSVEDAHEAIIHAHKSLDSLNKLIEDIFQLTIIRNKKEDAQSLNVSDLVEASFEKLSSLKNFDRLAVTKDYTQEMEEITTKKVAFTAIVENLLSNAIKYQDIEKESSFVNIVTYVENQEFIFEVKDNGLGIPKDQRKNLFAMFKRFHPKVSFGTGLGMHLMKKSADSLSGSIQLVDNNQQATESGSTFQLRIPLAKLGHLSPPEEFQTERRA